MPDRILRCEFLESESWLSLKDNADRAAWIACVLTIDNFGDMAGGPQRLARLWRPYGLDTPEKAAHTFANLIDVDLARRYEVAGKSYLHLPRFRQRLRWVGHAFPLSPWATDEEKQLYAKKYPEERRRRSETDGQREVKRVDIKAISRGRAREGSVDNYEVADPNDAKVKIAFLKTEDRKPNGWSQQWNDPAWVAATAQTLEIARIPGENDELFRDRVYQAVSHQREGNQ